MSGPAFSNRSGRGIKGSGSKPARYADISIKNGLLAVYNSRHPTIVEGRLNEKIITDCVAKVNALKKKSGIDSNGRSRCNLILPKFLEI